MWCDNVCATCGEQSNQGMEREQLSPPAKDESRHQAGTDITMTKAFVRLSWCCSARNSTRCLCGILVTASWKALLSGALQCCDNPTAGLCWDLEAFTHFWHVYLMLFHVIYFAMHLQQWNESHSLLDVWCCKCWSRALSPAGEQCPQLGAPAVCWDTKQVQPLLRWKVHPLVIALC